MASELYLHEDEWGMISLEPRENYDDRRRVVAEARAHSEEHRAPDGAGWTAIYVAPEAPVKLETRGLTAEALHAELGPRWSRFEKVTSGYSSHREDCPTAYAFHHAASGTDFANVLYGNLAGAHISTLCLTRADRSIGEVLHRLGVTVRLILCDLWRDEVVDLADRLAVERYLADDAGDDDQD